MSIEDRLKEARTYEAMKNGYMGLEGKLAVIASYLGQPIFHQGSRMFEQTHLEDPYALDEPEDIPMMDEEENSYEMGVQFDGLSRGMNMTISVQYHMREIICRYMGRIVYAEVSGELEGYAPAPEWETKIELLSNFARKIQKQKRPAEKRRKLDEDNKKRFAKLDELRLKWGLN